MIRIIIALALFLASQVVDAQSNYEKGMEKAFALMSEDKNEEAANLLERISKAEAENWLPAYHLALLKARTSFTMKDKTKQEALIKAAEEFIERADDLSPENSEIYVVKGMVNVAKIASNPMVYGASLSAPTAKLYQKAIDLDNSNPRAFSGLVEFEMGAARFFGQDLSPFCKRLKSSIAMYDAFKLKGQYHPNWGKDWTTQVLKGCGDTKDSNQKESKKETTTKGITISVTVPNISGTDGEVVFALYDSSEGFATRNAIDSKKAVILNGKSSVVFENIKPGTYAVVCLHDKNTNGRMDFETSGMPKEDYGSSNNVMRMGPPNFDDAKFTVENKSVALTIRF